LHFSAGVEDDVLVYGVETMSSEAGIWVRPKLRIRKEANLLFHIMLTALEADSGRIRDFGLFGKPSAISMELAAFNFNVNGELKQALGHRRQISLPSLMLEDYEQYRYTSVAEFDEFLGSASMVKTLALDFHVLGYENLHDPALRYLTACGHFEELHKLPSPGRISREAQCGTS